MFRKFLSEKLHISSRDINFLKRELLKGGLIYEYMAASVPAVSLTELGWESARLGLKKLEEENATVINALAPALGVARLSQALTDQPKAIALLNLIGKTDPSDRK